MSEVSADRQDRGIGRSDLHYNSVAGTRDKHNWCDLLSLSHWNSHPAARV